MLLLLWDQKLMDQSLMASSSPCAHRTIVRSKLATIISCKIPFISKFVLWKKWKFERKISPKFTVWSVKFVVNRSVSKLVQVFPLNHLDEIFSILKFSISSFRFTFSMWIINNANFNFFPSTACVRRIAHHQNRNPERVELVSSLLGWAFLLASHSARRNTNHLLSAIRRKL